VALIGLMAAACWLVVAFAAKAVDDWWAAR
jgi:hypothetical protein